MQMTEYECFEEITNLTESKMNFEKKRTIA